MEEILESQFSVVASITVFMQKRYDAVIMAVLNNKITKKLVLAWFSFLFDFRIFAN